ncbi:MAG: MotA/TolQ/ExbB proton channel family protein, partial [Proteobacteria bacterium]|nr:MotA/TolQ/ExbB proton channel family protein [Pseudomonadota bacterium]
MKSKVAVVLFLLAAVPNLASAWWNDDWPSRKQITVDGAATGGDVQETLTDFPLLVRLHTGNFGYFADLGENGKDLRFMVDDKNPMKHHVEKLDPVNEMALVWVKVPKLRGGVATDSLWMYYGNGNTADGSDSKGSYDVDQSLVFHFAEGAALPEDATAYGNNAAESRAVIDPAGWIGAGARFDGSTHIDVKASPSIAVVPENGWTFSAWVKIDAPQQPGLL